MRLERRGNRVCSTSHSNSERRRLHGELNLAELPRSQSASTLDAAVRGFVYRVLEPILKKYADD